MNPLDYIYQKLQEVITYLNLMRENSKRIDELPASTTGTKLVAVWNETAEETQKAASTTLFNQNNTVSYNKYGLITGNGLLTTIQLATYLNSINHIKTVTETATPVIYEALKANIDKVYKYVFFFRLGKGTYSNFEGSNFVLISTTEITPADIDPGVNDNFYNLGQIPSLSDFVSVANSSDTYNFTDPTKTNYFTYSVLYYPGTPQEYEVLYISMFVGEPGTYGLEGDNQFADSDFIDTANSAPSSDNSFRLNYGEVIKIGKGYIETENGFEENTGGFNVHEKGDLFMAYDKDGYFRLPMRYGGIGDPFDIANQYYETGVKVNIPGEPNYVAPE